MKLGPIHARAHNPNRWSFAWLMISHGFISCFSHVGGKQWDDYKKRQRKRRVGAKNDKASPRGSEFAILQSSNFCNSPVFSLFDFFFPVWYLIVSYIAIHLCWCSRWSISTEPYGSGEKFTVIVSMLRTFAYQLTQVWGFCSVICMAHISVNVN